MTQFLKSRCEHVWVGNTIYPKRMHCMVSFSKRSLCTYPLIRVNACFDDAEHSSEKIDNNQFISLNFGTKTEIEFGIFVDRLQCWVNGWVDLRLIRCSDLRSHSPDTTTRVSSLRNRVCSRSATKIAYLYVNFDLSEPWTVHFWRLIQEVSVDFGRDIFLRFFIAYSHCAVYYVLHC